MSTFFERVRRRINYIKWQLYVIIKGPGIRSFVLSDSILIDYPLNSEVGKQLFSSNFETDEISYLSSVIRQGDVVLDIGANAGIYSALVSKWVGRSGHVYAFEIGPDEINLFRRNMTNNGIVNVTLLEYALSNKTGKAQFALSSDGAMNSLAKNDHPHQKIERWIEVNTLTLSDAAEKFTIKHVDVIKMDVEGAEKLVFEGGVQQLLKWKPRCILFESSDLTVKAFGYTVSSFMNYLIREGFNVYSLRNQQLIPITGDEHHDISEYNFVATLK